LNELLGATDRRTNDSPARPPKKLPEPDYSNACAPHTLDPIAGQIAAGVLPTI